MVIKDSAVSHKIDDDFKTKPVSVGGEIVFGGDEVIVIAGPCAVESYDQAREIAKALRNAGIRVMRGGAFKPRTSPHSFQGLGLEGLKIMRAVADEFSLLVVTEALGVEHIPLMVEHADIIQIGSRNMQHYPLLWAAGETEKPILLKRGFMASLNEWLMAGEHIASKGNENIILCERGIRTFESYTRNTMDAVSITAAKQLSPFPVIGDPSHATGRANLVIPAARISVAAGADGIIVEIHPNPSDAKSDSDQALSLDQLPILMSEINRIARAMGRSVV